MAGEPFRTHLAAELSDAHIGTHVRLAGWVAFKRVHKHVAFVGLRDRSGTAQVVCPPDDVVDVTRESCISVAGVVQRRQPASGGAGAELVEVAATRLDVLNPAAPLPFPVESPDVESAAHMRWRYLEMRHPDLLHRLLLRAQVASVLSRWAVDNGFVGLDTPYLAHRSSGGANEFEVVSTRDPSRRYALPQSSQVYRTLLMVGGIERFGQITRNFRDEWMRSNRQFEFSVLDLEASFITRDDIMRWIESALTAVAREVVGQQLPVPFPRVSYGHEPEAAAGRTGTPEFTWVIDQPLFLAHGDKLDTFHQPFDAPPDGWTGDLDDSPHDVPSTYFTLLANGAEIGGGSMRIHDADLLQRVLRLIGQDQTNTAVVEALRYGAPPHGGFTLALDALAVQILGVGTIRSVTAFPKSAAGHCAVLASRDPPGPLA